MKVKATINSWDFIPNISGNLVRFDAVFATEKSTKIDPKSFKEIEFDIPVVNELEKYSSKELEDELNSRNENYVVCKYCNSRLRKLSVFFVGKSFTCPMCGQINYQPYPYKGEF